VIKRLLGGAGGALLLVATVWFGGRAPAATPSAEPATMWLAASTGRLVRANGLVESSPAQIVESLDFAAARAGVRLLPTAHALVVVAADGALTSVDIRTRRVTATASAAGAAVETDGERIFRVRGDDVTVLDPGSLRELTTQHLAAVAGRSAVPGALFVATTSGAVLRVTYPSEEATTVAQLGPIAITAFAAAPDGKSFAAFAAAPDGTSFAVLDGRELRVQTGGRVLRQELAFAPGQTLALDQEAAYVDDPRAGVVHRFRVAAGLTEESALVFNPSMRLDVHRNRQFVWFDDVRGPVSWAVHEGRPRKISKFRVRPPAPAPTTPPTTPPPTTPPPSGPPSPPPTTPPTTPTKTPTPKKKQHPKPAPKKPTPKKSKSPSPSPTGDPLERCGGRPTALKVHKPQATGSHPKITVTVCERAAPGSQYWIMSLSEGQWFAKRKFTVGDTYVVELLNGSGAPGEHRDFVIVAARTGSARDWLNRNHRADLRDDPEFSRDDLPDDIDEVSEPVPTTS
jgi:hypothetical protein